MPTSTNPAVEACGLTKRFGSHVAVDTVSFELAPGTVTGFLGRNGAGKSTTLRMLLGLVTPTAGRAAFGGIPYRELPDPVRRVGAVLDATGLHPGRRARQHLRTLATGAGIAPERVDACLELVGLDDVAEQRIGTFSLGMRQRLALATALLGDPEVLLLDEPANGLDPDGIQWLRRFVRRFGEQGRTVLISSHLLAELAQTVDHVLIIDRGRIVDAGPIEDLVGRGGHGRRRVVRVRTPMIAELRRALGAGGLHGEADGPDAVLVHDADTEQVGRIAAAAGVVVVELAPLDANLEDVFFALTAASTGEDRS